MLARLLACAKPIPFYKAFEAISNLASPVIPNQL